MNDQLKRWFVERVAQNPEYLATTYLPAMERHMDRAEKSLHQSIRNDDTLRIKYVMGYFDGVKETCALLEGLRTSETRKPVEPGLMARIFGSES